MSGSSSKRRFRPLLRDDWDRMSSPRQWKGVRTSAWIRTIDCFRTKTRCRTEDSGTSLLCRSRGLLANRTTRSSWMAPLLRGPISGRFSRAFAQSRDRRSNRLSRMLNAEAASSASDCHHRTMKKRSLGPRLRHVEERPLSSVNCQSRWTSFLAIRSTSPSNSCILGFETDCFGWRRSRIPNSIRRSRCGFRHTTSHVLSRAQRIFRITSVCRAGASTTFARR